MERIGFIGLGKLGLPCALALSCKLGSEVVGFDLDNRIAGYIRSKSVPYLEEEIDPYLHSGNVKYVQSVKEVVSVSSTIFFAIQTPHEPQFEGNVPVPNDTADFNYEFLRNAVKEVCEEIKKQGKSGILLVVISTVLPGTMRREILPIINELCPETEFCYNPFFIAMGTTIPDFINPEFILVGSDEQNSISRLATIYSKVNSAPLVSMQIESAELTKVAYNTFIGFKIVFANTIAEIVSKTGGDSDEVTDALAKASSRLMSGRYLRAGMADGGGCHPRDQIAMSHLSNELNLSVNTFDWLARARDSQTKRQAEFIERIADEKRLPVVLLGRAYKKNVNLTVGSPADLLSSFLGKFGVEHIFYDPHVYPNQSLPETPALFFISCNHDVFKNLQLPKKSICIDPWGDAISDCNGVEILRPGRTV